VRGSKAKYQRIYEHLQDAIVAGKYAVGQRLPTEAELGARHGASRLTVARALRELEHSGYLMRRRGVGSFVSKPRGTRSNLFGIIMPRPSEGIFSRVCEEILLRSKAKGYGLLLAGSLAGSQDLVSARAAEFCEELILRKVAGVFFGPLEVPPERVSLNRQIADRLIQAGIAVVLLDCDLYEYPRRSEFDLVGVNNRASSYAATEHLLGLGCRRVHYLAHRWPGSTVTARIAGYRDAMLAYGISPDSRWIHHWDFEDRAFVRELMQPPRAEAFVCVNDWGATAFMHSLAVLGVRVPEDVRIVGFDDEERNRHLPVGLTTMRQPAKQLGIEAVEIMLDRLADPDRPAREITLSCDLVVRESCGAALSRTSSAAAG
jgi:GntR family transcriptional regulator of arabinose operon